MNRKTSYTKDELLLCSNGEMFGQGNAQLPLPPMLMVDRIIEISENSGTHGLGRIIAEQDISPDLWFFDCHFKNDPVMPGCLGLDATWQLLGFYLAWKGYEGRGRARGGLVKFNGTVLPTAKVVTYELNITRLVNQRLKMGIADATVSVDGKQIYTMKDLTTVLTLTNN